jgi:putative endonuclease
MAAARSADSNRRAAERRGHLAEQVAVLLLWLRGYRILARRWRVRAGEIDIVAVRGWRLAFVEVKYRAAHEAAAYSIRPRQMQRLHAAAAVFVDRHPHYRDHDHGFDAVWLSARCWPTYARDHLQPWLSRRRMPAFARTQP